MKNFYSLILVCFLLQSCVITEVRGQQSVVDEVTKTFSDITNLEVQGSFCNVQIDGENTSSISFHGIIKSNKNSDDIKIKYQTTGSTLKVWIEHPNSFNGMTDGNLTFKIPQQTIINVDNSSGNVAVTNLSKAEVKLKASSGSIHAENIANDMEVSTSSGNIKAIAIDGALKANSSSGDQIIQHISGDLKTTSSSGSIKITNVKGNLICKSTSGSQVIVRATKDSYCEASSGSIIFEDSNGNISAETSSGSIKLTSITGSLQLESSSGSQSGSNITLTDNSSFKSSSGSIHMDITNSAEDLSFDLDASSGGLRAKGISGNDHLKIDKGQILIKGRSSSGSQKYE